jgi:hypothetical protein
MDELLKQMQIAKRNVENALRDFEECQAKYNKALAFYIAQGEQSTIYANNNPADKTV